MSRATVHIAPRGEQDAEPGAAPDRYTPVVRRPCRGVRDR